MKPDSSPDLSQMAETRRVARTELAFVLVLFLVGTALRCAYPSRMAVEHFDEGVYASDCWFGPDDDFHYPDQHLYAPPLLPTFIWWSTTLFGPSNLAVMLPSLVAGCLTIPLVWWIGRSWFGIPLGLATAVLATFSDLHILFCRTALTDVILTFWLLLAVYFFWRAMTLGGYWPLLASGVFTGLAWWTKYSGWLPLAITLSGGLAWWIYGRWLLEPRVDSDRRQSATSIAWRWCVVAAVTLAIWSPWWLQLEREGGYSAVAANHRGYVVGLSGWLASFERQTDVMLDTGGWPTLIGIVLFALVVRVVRRCDAKCFTWNGYLGRGEPAERSRWVIDVGLALVVAGALVHGAGLFQVSFPLAILALPALPRLLRSLGLSLDVGLGRLSTWLALAWGLGLLVTVPLYAAYPRLLLPLLAAGWLSASAFAFCVLTARTPPATVDAKSTLRPPKFPDPLLNFAKRWGLLALGTVLLVGGSPVVSARSAARWQDRTGLVTLGRKIVEQVTGESLGGSEMGGDRQSVIYTYADPAMLFQLRLAGAETVRPVSSLGFADPAAKTSPVPVYVVIGPQARRTAGFDEQFARAEARLELVAEFDFSPSDVVLLDNRDAKDRPPAPGTGGQRPVYKQQLYRVR